MAIAADSEKNLGSAHIRKRSFNESFPRSTKPMTNLKKKTGRELFRSQYTKFRLLPNLSPTYILVQNILSKVNI